jgi:hypothetical protein
MATIVLKIKHVVFVAVVVVHIEVVVYGDLLFWLLPIL